MNHESLDQQVAHLIRTLADGNAEERRSAAAHPSTANFEFGRKFKWNVVLCAFTGRATLELQWSVSMVLVAGHLFSGFCVCPPAHFLLARRRRALRGISLQGADHVGSTVTNNNITVQVEQVLCRCCAYCHYYAAPGAS